MYCNHCGAAVGSEQLVCPQCGKGLGAASATLVAPGRLPAHLHLLAILWFVLGGLKLIAVPVMVGLAGMSSAVLAQQSDVPPMVRVLGPTVFIAGAILIGVISAVEIVTGYGLLKVRPWGRILAVVMGFLSLLSFPFGTALGIYTLIVLLPAHAGAEYGHLVARAAQARSARAV